VLHLIDHILPHAAYRQWVITISHALRNWLARDNTLVSRINKIATACIGKHLANKAISNGATTPLPGMITFIQRAGSALSAKLHLHILAIDGVYAAPASLDARSRLHPLSGPRDDEVAEVVVAIARRTIRHLQRRGLLDAEGEVVSRLDGDELVGGDRAMSMATQASVFNKIAFGPRAGRMVRKIGKGFGYREGIALARGRQCASINGFNLRRHLRQSPRPRSP
jgi:hypothetical protein